MAAHYHDERVPISIENIRQIQQRKRLAQDSKWHCQKAKIKNQIRQHVNKKLDRRTNIYYRLHKQAQKGKNYLRLTDYGFIWTNPLSCCSTDEQFEILSEIVEDLQSTIDDTYGPEFVLDVQDSPDKFSKIFGLIDYDIYLLYENS